MLQLSYNIHHISVVLKIKIGDVNLVIETIRNAEQHKY